MVEPTDAILPMLQRIQADIAALTRKVEAQGEVLAQHSEKLDAIEGYLTYQLGISSRTVADVEKLRKIFSRSRSASKCWSINNRFDCRIIPHNG